MSRFLRAAAACVALVMPLLSASPAAAREIRTTNYDLYVEAGVDPVETGRMLDALHQQLTAFFGRAPEGRLRFEIYRDQEGFEAALARDNQPYEDGAGLYGPTFRKVWLAVQPTEHYTRQLILHEATHQFHFLVATGNRFPSAHWYMEGFAEYMGLHNWDGRELATGVVPAITLEDYPARAFKAFDEADWDFGAAVRGEIDVGQAGGWALVHFLANHAPLRFRALATALDARQTPADAIAEIFAEAESALAVEFQRWLREHRQPWEWVWNSWQQRGEWIEGESEVVGMARLKERRDRLEVVMDPVEGDLDGGLVFGFRSREDFHVLKILGNRAAEVIRRYEGQWQRIAGPTPRPFAAGPRRLAVEQGRDGVRLLVDGQLVHSMPVSGDMGLLVDASRVRFRVVAPPAAAARPRLAANG